MMNTKRQRPSPEQWAKLDTALEKLRGRTPPGVTPPLSREITQRADALRAAMESGWRIRDLAAFFRESAGIDVSPSTIQAALRQALNESEPDARRARAKRPRKQNTSGQEAGTGAGAARGTGAVQPSRGPAPPPVSPEETADLFTEGRPTAPHAKVVTPLGSTFTPGATKRGQR